MFFILRIDNIYENSKRDSALASNLRKVRIKSQFWENGGKSVAVSKNFARRTHTPIDTTTYFRQYLLFISLFIGLKVLLGTCS